MSQKVWPSSKARSNTLKRSSSDPVSPKKAERPIVPKPRASTLGPFLPRCRLGRVGMIGLQTEEIVVLQSVGKGTVDKSGRQQARDICFRKQCTIHLLCRLIAETRYGARLRNPAQGARVTGISRAHKKAAPRETIDRRQDVLICDHDPAHTLTASSLDNGSHLSVVR